MYDEGDDETKRAIAKSWYETQQQQHNIPEGVETMGMDQLEEMMK